MYSILKILLSLKLTFILIIFGVGGMYILEKGALMRSIAGPHTIRYIQTVEDVQVESLKEITPLDRPEKCNKDQSSLNPCSLSDLRLFIEF